MQVVQVISRTPRRKTIFLAAHCVAHYRMNDNAASTTVIDSQGFSNGTAQQNTSALTTWGRINEALTFNGTSDYVDTNNTFQGVFQNDFSISVWVKPTDGQPTVSNFICGVANKNGGGVYTDIVEILFGTTGKVYFYYYAGYPSNPAILVLTSSSVNFSNGQQNWHHIIGKIYQDGSKISGELYFDRVLVKSATSEASGVMSAFSSDRNFAVGCTNDEWIGGPYGYFNGVLDDVMIFNKAINKDEINFLYNKGCGTEGLP